MHEVLVNHLGGLLSLPRKSVVRLTDRPDMILDITVDVKQQQHTYIQGNRPSESGEEDFLRFLPYMGMAAIFVMWPGSNILTFFPPLSGG